MEDEFLLYLKRKIKSRLIMSFNNTDLLVWGSRGDDGVKLLGLTLNIGVRNWERVNDVIADNRVINAMQVASSLSRSSHSTFFAIVYSQSGANVFRVTDPKDPTNWSKSFSVKEAEMPKLIQRFFKTNLQTRGTLKPVNRATSDWFHDWARGNLPREYVRINIDGLILDKSEKPNILLETKRSIYYDVDSWQPWRDDARNYYLQHLLATKADLRFWTVYHEKGEVVTDRTRVAVFIISKVSLDKEDKWIAFSCVKTNASDVSKNMLNRVSVEFQG